MKNLSEMESQKLFEDLFERATALANLGQLIEALKLYGEAYKIKPESYEVLWNTGIINEDFGRYEIALSLYEKVLQLNPDAEYLLGNEQLLRMRICDWNNFEGKVESISRLISCGKKISPPFATTSLLDSPELQMLSAKIYGFDNFPLKNNQAIAASKNNKIRLGYFSANFNNHAMAHLLAGVYEAHDSNQFELFAFSFGPAAQDPLYVRLRSSFDHFYDVGNKSDEEIARLSRDLNIDIAIDLMGYTRDMRAGIFAHRAAPIQVNFLGYPGTMGLSYYDYIIADKILIPEQSQRFYIEKIAYLPNSYQANDSKRIISDRQFTRGELGLPEEGFIFACFNNLYKVTPSTFDMWARILNATPGSVLWLFENHPVAAKNLKAEAAKRGLSLNRIIFASLMPNSEHLARLKLADLFLDTAPYGAHTTASDALWAGLPVITLIGNSFASRVGASLLNAVGLPELITSTRAEYERLAIHLVNNPHTLAEIRGRLKAARTTCALFDTSRYVKDIELAYTKMVRDHGLGNLPDHIYIS
jgi:predicted O-linked N-acetylglucosamine transferase (SPINDLY family)